MKGKFLPFSSMLASFSPPAYSEVFRDLPHFASQSALNARKCIFLLPFALLPADFTTLPTWNTLILQLALCLLHSAQLLPGHSPYQLATFSSAVSSWPHIPFNGHFLLPALEQHFSFCFFSSQGLYSYLPPFPDLSAYQEGQAFGRSQDQNHLQELTTHLIIAFDTNWLSSSFRS